MKFLKTLPTEQGFFEVYAKLAKAIRLSGFFAQAVSALTEIGGIYAATLSALVVIFPDLAIYMAAIVAALGTVTIEGGLRVLFPQAIDAILHRRFSGLHLPMTIFIWLLTVVLMGTSGLLSFRNSTVIVDNFTAPSEEGTTAAADSVLHAKEATLLATWQADSAAIATKWVAMATTADAAYRGQIEARKTELANIRRKEQRTGASYASQRDNTRAAIAALEAERAAKLAELEAGKAQEASAARQEWKDGLQAAGAAHLAATGEVKASNQQAKDERAATVAAYGGGLGWFTVVCLILFGASVILDRIHRKGSGIEEKAQISQRDFSPGIFTEAFAAISERLDYAFRSRITNFANRTPPAPLPADPAELYDPAQLANVKIILKVDQGEDGEAEQVVYVTPKRRQIGFNTHAQDAAPTHENSRAIKGTPNEAYHTPDLWQLKQRLKDYKKRLGSFQQKADALERKGKPVPKRTLTAIENNRQWVDHYTNLIQQAENKAD